MFRKIKITISLIILFLLVGLGIFINAYYQGKIKLKAQMEMGASQFSVTSDGRDCKDNSVIRCGALSKDELAEKINNGDGSHNDIKNIFHTLGIYPNEFLTDGNIDGAELQTTDGYVTKSGAVYVNGNPNPVATGVISAGRIDIDGSTQDVFGLPIWWRSPSVSFASDPLDAFVHLVNGQFSWAVLKSCGNPIKTYGNPQITIEKSVRNITNNQEAEWSKEIEANKGDIIEFKMSYKVGSESLNNVWLYDALKGNTFQGTNSNREYLSDPFNLKPQFLTWYPDGIQVPNGYQDKRMLVWLAPGRAPQSAGEATFQVKISNNTPDNITIINDFCCYAGRIGTVCSNPVSIHVSAEPPPPHYSLTIDKTVAAENSPEWVKNNSANPGSIIKYKIEYKNNGNQDLTDVTIKDKLPENVSYINNSTIINGGKVSNNNITTSGINIGKLAKEASGNIIFKARISNNLTEDKLLINHSCADSNETREVCSTASTEVKLIINYTELKEAINLTQGSVDATKIKNREGDKIRYNLTTINKGNIPINIVVTDDLADILQYANINDLGGGSLEGTIIKYPEKQILVDEKIENNFEVTIKPVSEWPNLGDLNMTNVYGDTVNVPLGFTNILQSKFAFNETQKIPAIDKKAKSGDVIKYTLEVTNTGNMKVEKYTMEEDISDILQYADITEKDEDAVIENNKIRWTVDIEPNGQKTARSFKITIKDSKDWPALGDLIMTNVYGNKIDILIDSPSVARAVIAPMVLSLTSTGTLILLIILLALLITVVYIIIKTIIVKRNEKKNK